MEQGKSPTEETVVQQVSTPATERYGMLLLGKPQTKCIFYHSDHTQITEVPHSPKQVSHPQWVNGCSLFVLAPHSQLVSTILTQCTYCAVESVPPVAILCSAQLLPSMNFWRETKQGKMPHKQIFGYRKFLAHNYRTSSYLPARLVEPSLMPP